MAMQVLNYQENSLNFEKFKKNPKKSNLKSFYAFLLSLFIYISVFYVFNLSPSTLLCTTKFWFFISNTLILIIAADFGAFSSSEKHDFYDDFVKNNVRTKADVHSFETTTTTTTATAEAQAATKPVTPINWGRLHETNEHHVQTKNVITKDVYPFETKTTTSELVIPTSWDKLREPDQNHVEAPCMNIVEPHEKIIDMVVPYTTEEERVREQNPDDEFEKNKKEIISFTPKTESKKVKPKCARSNSDKATLMSAVSESEERNVLRRTSSERYDDARFDEENEYSSLSNEELNERVEDFIRRFNKQIRLQAVRNRHHELDLHRV